MLAENEIIVSGYPVKYHDINYCDNYVLLTQNRTKRRIPNGYYFEDTGVHLYVSGYYSHLFQSKQRQKLFILNRLTKEWKNVEPVVIEKHIPEKKQVVEKELLNELRK
jgi:hypothetical protein